MHNPSSFSVAIIAGGLATRMHPYTQTVPKSLLEVNGRPFLATQLEQLASHGIQKVVLCVGHLADQIQAEFGDGSAYGINLHYSHDGERLVGTGAAVRNAIPMLGEHFFTLYGDSYLTVDYSAAALAFWQSDKLGLMTVFRNNGLYDASNVEYSDGKIVAYSKQFKTAAMNHIDYGLNAFRADAFDSFKFKERFDLSDVISHLVAGDQLAAFEVHDRFYEIGSPSGLDELNTLLKSRSDRN